MYNGPGGSQSSFNFSQPSFYFVSRHQFSHRSQLIVLPIQKVSQTFIKANLRPKSFCLGVIGPKVSFYECLGYFLYW